MVAILGLISLVKTTALIRCYRRQLDNQGQIIATPVDYQTVRELVNDMYVDSSTGATRAVRELVEAVIRLDGKRIQGERITNTMLARELGTGVKQITRRAARAIKAGWLVNQEQRKSYPADYLPGEPLPEVEGLPLLPEWTGLTGVDSPLSTVFEAKDATVDRLTPLTDDNASPVIALPYPAFPCQCGGNRFWLRQASQFGKAEWLCTRCHPRPGGEAC